MMESGVPIPVHLAVHLLGVTVAAGLAVYAVGRRREAGPGWLGLVLGGVLIAGSHVASGALLAGDLAWPLYVRAAGYAALAAGAAGGVLGTTRGPGVVVVLGPQDLHLATAAAGTLAVVATLRGVLGRGREVLPLAVGLAGWAGADAVARASVGAAAALSVAGSAAAAWWLYRRSRRSLLARYTGAFLAVLLVLAVGLASASGIVLRTDLEGDELTRLEGLVAAQADLVADDWPLELQRNAAPLAGATLAAELRAAAGPDGGNLDRRRAAAITSLPGVDVAVLVVPDGRVVGSWSATAAPPGPLAPAVEAAIGGDELVARALAGSAVHGLIGVGADELLAVGAVPVAPREDGEPELDEQAGALLLGRHAADPRVVSEISRRTGTEAALLVGGEVAASTLGQSADRALARAATLTDGSRLVDVGQQRRFVSVAPLRHGGEELGAVVLSVDAGDLAGLEETFTRVLFLAALVGLLLAGGLAALAATRTTRPVRQLTAAAEEVAEGDLSVRTAVDREDEVGRLGAAFDHMTAALEQRQAELRDAAATEAALRTRLEIVTTSMEDALLATDAAGRITTANPAAAELLGRDRDALVGAALDAVLEGQDELGTPLAEALGTGGATGVRGVVVPADGRPVPVAATAAPLRSDEDGPVMGRVYVIRDITGEAEVERMKTEFLSNISHELRTPLTPIRGFAEVMRHRELDVEQQREFGRNIAQAATRLERVIGMLVDFAALEAGRVDVRLQPTDLGAEVGKVLSRWRDRKPERTFRRYVRRDLPSVQVDPDLLGRVFEEVIDNAVKFSDGPVRLLAEREDADTVRLTIGDEGVGIAPDRLESITEDFHQADGSATREIGGLGLGLAIVRRILARFEADIEIESTPDEGTEVHLLLPVARS